MLGEARAGEEEKVDDRNFMTRLYEDENFVQEKALMEEQIVKATQETTESKNFIQEMDEFLKDLESWKKTRDFNVTEEESKTLELVDDGSDARLAKLEEEFMKKANERERVILEKLKALNIDPT